MTPTKLPELLFGKPPPYINYRYGWGYGFNYGRRHGDGFCEMLYAHREGHGAGWTEAEGKPTMQPVWHIEKH